MTDVREPGRSTRAKVIAFAIAGVIILLAGYLPGRLAAREAIAESRAAAASLAEVQTVLATTKAELAEARLRGILGMAMFEAERNNFASAASYATAFFEGLRSLPADGIPPARRARIDQFLRRRDELSADLARADAAVKAKLSAMYVEMGRDVDPPVAP
jgi:hypothetical protein